MRATLVRSFAGLGRDGGLASGKTLEIVCWDLWCHKLPIARTRREAAKNTMASFAGDDYALERRKLRELQASVSRSTNRPPSEPRKKAPTPTSDGTAAAAAAAVPSLVGVGAFLRGSDGGRFVLRLTEACSSRSFRRSSA